MASIILTRLEKVLLVLTAFILLTSIILALCISLVLPYHWTTEDYVPRNADNSEELYENCKCGQQRLTTDYINCIPRVFSQRVILGQNKQTSSGCEMIQNYPYVVSLNAPTYSDDMDERRYACAGIILSTTWILVGQDCVRHHDELKELRVRAGSSYWSKEGIEYGVLATSSFTEQGSIALKVDKPFVFNEFIDAIKIPGKRSYDAWDSAVSIGWSKNNDRKYDKFIVRRWTTAPCAKGDCSTGEVKAEPISVCQKQKIGNALVTDTKLLIGIQSEICYDSYNMSKYIFTDTQTKNYRKWFQFLNGNLEEQTEKGIKNVVRKPLKIYEVEECINSTENNEVSESDYNTPATDTITETKSSKYITNLPFSLQPEEIRVPLTVARATVLNTVEEALSQNVLIPSTERYIVTSSTSLPRQEIHLTSSSKDLSVSEPQQSDKFRHKGQPLSNSNSSTENYNALTFDKSGSTEYNFEDFASPIMHTNATGEYIESKGEAEPDESVTEKYSSEFQQNTPTDLLPTESNKEEVIL